MNPRIDRVIEPLDAVVRSHLRPIVGERSLALLLGSLGGRLRRSLAPDSLERVGLDPFVDRELRRCYLELFREVSGAVFGGELRGRLRVIERELEDGIVPA